MLLYKRLQHYIKFATSTAWLMLAHSINLLNNQSLFRELQQCSFLLLMICLNRETQQSANVLQTAIWLCPFYFMDCWVPGFFLMEMFSCFSATSMSLSNTSLRSSSCFSCRSSNAIFSSNAAWFASASFCFLFIGLM